jgi:tetratricopeptide (TPR) repeat protein
MALARASAAADESQEFELGKNRFDAGQYEEAAKRFTTMVDPAVPPCEKEAPKKRGGCRLTDRELIERARTFAAASLIALRRLPEADAHIERVLRANPTYTPNPAIFPPEVSDRFTEVRGRIGAELDAIAQKEAEAAYAKQMAAQKAREDEERWLRELERLAGEERIIVRNSRWIALLPFGVGQLQNGDTGLGIFFAVSQAVAGGVSIGFAGAASYFESVDPNAVSPDTEKGLNVGEINAQLATMRLVNRIAFGAWAALAVAGIIQAQVAFVPERVTVSPRPIPKRPAPVVLPTVSITPGSMGVGLAGRF